MLRNRVIDKKPHHITPTEVKRHKVLSLLEYGIKPADICAKMGYCPDLVRLVDKKRRAGHSLAPNFKGGKPRTDEFLKKIGRIFKEKPGQNYTVTALELGVSVRTVRRSADQLGYKSYRHRYRALLTAQMKIKRLERSEELLIWLKTPSNTSTVIIFSGIDLIDR